MILTLDDHATTYPYGVLEYVLVRVDGLLLPADFIILGMSEDSETPLLLVRPFLDTCEELIDVSLGELILRFNDEKFVFNVFEAMDHKKRKPFVLPSEHDERNI